MSMIEVRNQMSEFLMTETPEVLAIRGEWGVGKTFAWERLLEEKKPTIKLQRYCYVSLFGIDSIENLKKALFQNTISCASIGIEPSLKTFSDNWKSQTRILSNRFLRKSTRLSKIIDHIPLLNSFPAAETIHSASFLTVSKTVICIDDLERSGPNLNQQDIMGLISQLKEQKKCKVVILLNDKHSHMEHYHEHREKVIDQELIFSPTPTECASVVFASDNYIDQLCTGHAVDLGIKNIRVLKKIKSLSTNLAAALNGMHESVIKQSIHSLVLFCWCFYCSKAESSIPTLEYVIKKASHYSSAEDEKAKTLLDRQWDSTLSSYKYHVTDDFDLEVKDSVVSGFVNRASIIETAKPLQERAILGDKGQIMTTAWNLFQFSLDNNVDTISSLFTEAVNVCAGHMSAYELSQIVTLFRDLGNDTKANEFIEIFIESNRSRPLIFNLKDRMTGTFSPEIHDKQLIARLNEEYIRYADSIKPKDHLTQLSQDYSWHPFQVPNFRGADSSEITEAIRAAEPQYRRKFISTMIEIGMYDHQQNKHQEFATNLLASLQSFSDESIVNRLRFAKLISDIEAHAANPRASPSTQQ